MSFDQTKDTGPISVPLAANTEIGGYRLIAILGEGGMGVVWSAHDPDLDRIIAIKVLRHASAEASMRKRLLREGRAMARLKHPNVLTVYEVGSDRGRDYIAMELVEGGSLDRWLSTQPPRDEVIQALLAAGRGLAAAHAAGLVHRDFKPHNVLRSADGRVLVTDFGLARGLGEEPGPGPASLAPGALATPAFDVTLEASASPTPARHTDSLLDRSLTQTGALIGTPAYMAPEQYYGSEPDPRTDQFAFCVTAWQALTGSRPFNGATLDEMRKAALAGIPKDAPADLARPVRAALVRGLDPDPDHRWPDLPTLLDELERATRKARTRWVMPMLGLSAIGVATAVVMIMRGGTHAADVAASPCESAEQVFAEAWSPAVRSEIDRAVQGPQAADGRIADVFDQVRARWIAAYDQTCKAPAAPLFHARLGCLLGVRDQVSALTVVLRMTRGKQLDRFDLHAMVPNLAVCNGASPVAPPAFPIEPELRGKVLGAVARGMALVAVPDDQLAAEAAKLEADARALPWPPLVAQIEMLIGNEQVRRGQLADARTHLEAALTGATEVHDTRSAAAARLGLLQASMRELAEPTAPHTATHAEAVMHPELVRLLTYAKSAVHAAGDDPILAGHLAALEADAQMQLGQWRRFKAAYSEALARAADARTQLEAAGDAHRLAIVDVLEARIYLARGDDRALDDALFAARSADDVLARGGLGPLPQVDELRAMIAFARRDFMEAHVRLHRVARDPTSTQPSHPIRVLDTAGAPTTRATVTVWRGELHGDPIRIYTDPRRVDGEVAVQDADGTYTIHGAAGSLVMAEFVGDRSLPQVLGSEPAVLRLEPTIVLGGTVTGQDLFGVHAFARISAGTGSVLIEAPIEKDHTFRIGGIPRGAKVVTGTIGPAGTGTRRVIAGPGATKLSWPNGQGVEVIARSSTPPNTAWLFRGHVQPRTRSEVEELAAAAVDVASGSLSPIGADNTDAGRELYRPGDLHAVFTGNPQGPVTVCVARGDQVTCKSIDVKQGYSIDYADGRAGFDVTPIVLELDPVR